VASRLALEFLGAVEDKVEDEGEVVSGSQAHTA